MGPQAKEGQAAEEEDDGKCSDECRQQDAAERIINLMPGHS
jgi:hypothetical protein